MRNHELVNLVLRQVAAVRCQWTGCASTPDESVALLNRSVCNCCTKHAVMVKALGGRVTL